MNDPVKMLTLFYLQQNCFTLLNVKHLIYINHLIFRWLKLGEVNLILIALWFNISVNC